MFAKQGYLGVELLKKGYPLEYVKSILLVLYHSDHYEDDLLKVYKTSTGFTVYETAI